MSSEADIAMRERAAALGGVRGLSAFSLSCSPPRAGRLRPLHPLKSAPIEVPPLLYTHEMSPLLEHSGRAKPCIGVGLAPALAGSHPRQCSHY